MITRKCPKCSKQCVINEHEEFRWFCPSCTYIGRVASDDNIRELLAYKRRVKREKGEK